MKTKVLLFVALLAFSQWVFGQATINCFPEADDYHTGSTDGTDFTETSLINTMSGGGPLGWARFDVSDVPAGATIQSVEFNLYVAQDSYAYWQVWSLEDDPILGDAASVYADGQDGAQYAANNSNFPEPGWWIADLGSTAVSDLQNKIDAAETWFGVSVWEYETGGTYEITCDGWNETNVPFIVVTYLVPGAPLPPYNPYPPHNAFSVDVESDLSWDFGDATLTYDLYFGTDFPPTTKVVEDETAGATGTYEPGTLEFTTTYHWQVVAKNDAELETPGPVWTFTTACDAWAVPFFEDFSTVAPPELPYCWTGIVNSSSIYAYLQTIGYSGIDNGNCIYFYNSDDPAAEILFVTPQIEGGVAGMYANFWAWGYNDFAIGTMSDPADPGTYTEWATFTTTGVYQDYQEYEAFFTNYTGTDEFIAFKPVFTNSYQGVYIDDILIDVAPNCPKPTDPYAGSFTTTTADIGWTESGDATTWNIEYGEFGFLPTGTPTVTVTENPATLVDLTPGTAYEFYVQADCGTDDESYWVGPTAFQTACVASDVPYFEGFESVAAPDIPPCIIVENTNGDDREWFTTNDPLYVFDGVNAIRINYTCSNEMDDWFFSAPLNLLAGEAYIVQFYYTCNSSYYVEKMEVKWGTGGTSADMFEDPIFVDENISSNFEWQEGTAFFTPDEDGVYYVGWHGYSVTCQYNLTVDYITIDLAPSCLKPTDVAVDSVAQDAAKISWVENGEAASWNIEYGYAGFTPTGVANAVADMMPYTITGLESGTDYDVYVQADCGGGDVSWWSISASFTTVCDPALVPIFENFDGTLGTELPDCWRSLVETTGTGYAQVYQWNGYSDPKSLQLENANDPDATIIAISPPIADDDGLAGKWVRFYAWGYAPELAVGTISNPADPSTFNAISVISISNQYDVWGEYEVYFTNYTGSDELIAFKGAFTATYQTIYIDDVTIDHPPSCPKPTDLDVSDITTNSAMLHWTENGEALTWNIEYGYAGFTPSGLPTVVVDENPYELTGLESGTSYEFYVQAYCGVGDSSEWAGPYHFTTLCEPFEVPVIEDFNSASTPDLPNCWSSYKESISQWAQVETITWSTYSPPAALHFYNSNDPNPTLLAISPMVTDPVNELWINFFAYGYAPYVVVGAMSDPLDGSTYTAIDSVAISTSWMEYEIFLDEYVGDGMFIVLTASFMGTYQDVYVDDITIDHPPTCPKPADLYAQEATQTSIMLGWEENGEATTWNIEYGYAGFTPTGIGNAVADANPFELTDLEDGTAYEFYVQADCSGGDVSYWVGPHPFSTLCFPTLLAAGEYIEDFEGLTPPMVPPCITVENSNYDNLWWQSSFNAPNTGLSHLRIGYTFNNPMDDWFFSAPLDLLGGQSYLVTFSYTNNSTFYTEALEVKFGSAPVGDSMTSEQIFVDQMINYGGAYQDTTVSFTPAEDGVYFVGWHGFSIPGQWDLYVDDIMIEWDNSLVVVATADPDSICYGEETQLFGTGAGGSGNYNYSWTSNPPGFTSSDPEPMVAPDVTTDYILEINDGFVSIYDTVTVHVTQLPAQPTTPTGITFFCASWGSATYNTTTTSGANWYMWVLDPPEAGVITGTSASVSIDWNEGWLGLATLKVHGMHDECQGPISGGLNINVYLPNVQLSNFDTTCLQWPAFELTGGTPAGGVYTGTGVDDDGWFDPAVAGIGTHVITYTYSDPAACENHDTAVIVVDACTGLGEYGSTVDVSVTPNPNNGLFTLKVRSANADKVNVKVLNNFGEQVYSDNNVELHNNYSTEIDLSKYAKGLYYLHIYSDEVNYIEKIIVK